MFAQVDGPLPLAEWGDLSSTRGSWSAITRLAGMLLVRRLMAKARIVSGRLVRSQAPSASLSRGQTTQPESCE